MFFTDPLLFSTFLLLIFPSLFFFEFLLLFFMFLLFLTSENSLDLVFCQRRLSRYLGSSQSCTKAGVNGFLEHVLSDIERFLRRLGENYGGFVWGLIDE